MARKTKTQYYADQSGAGAISGKRTIARMLAALYAVAVAFLIIFIGWVAILLTDLPTN